MHNVGISFYILEDDTSPHTGSQKVTGYLVFDTKVYFTINTQLVLYVYKNTDPIGSTYADVVSIYRARIDFTYASLSIIYICVTDIRNTYIQSL